MTYTLDDSEFPKVIKGPRCRVFKASEKLDKKGQEVLAKWLANPEINSKDISDRLNQAIPELEIRYYMVARHRRGECLCPC